ncbi:NmrA-like family protein [Podospora appendiculata]|uniref:NmrA-like family protein n=1 Tax=Podospora appendiculata TaxID=314037 RepID=A0AAE0XDF3_9PEZI|nr:NmrA-like family protein [Podospora appendiculata]
MSRALLICGATGKQGGAVLANLLKEKNQLRVPRRDTQRKLRLRTNPARQGPLKDQAGPRRPIDNPTALFLAAQAALPPSGTIHGVFSVLHFIYSSVDRHGAADSPNTPTDIPHFRNKHLIEQHLIATAAGTSTAWTILRPVAFMENLTDNFFGRVFATSWKLAVMEKPLQLVAVSDFGFFGAQAFMHPEEYIGRGVSLAGDELTIEQAVRVFKEKTGREMGWANRLFCSVLMWGMKDFGLMFKWFYDVGYGADVEALRKVNPGMKDFGTWLETESDFRKGKVGN